MENIEFEFIDRAISLLKEGYQQQAVALIHNESGITLSESRRFVATLFEMMQR